MGQLAQEVEPLLAGADKAIKGSGYENQVTFKRYTGQDDEEAREGIRVSDMTGGPNYR